MHRPEFLLRCKIHLKVCKVLRSRFDNATKRANNTKALMRLVFNELLKEVGGSTRKAFNLLVLKIEQLSAIATPHQQIERAEIGTLMSTVVTIESMHWYVLDTVDIESITHFSGVVQKISHELTKMSICDPNCNQPIEGGSDRDNARAKKYILYALEVTDGKEAQSDSDDSDDSDTAKKTNSGRKEESRIKFGQRMYGFHPPKNRRNYDRSSRYCRFGIGKRYHRGNSGYSSGRTFDRRCFNCGKTKCQMVTCPEPKNEERIEANLTEWRKLMKLNKPIREVNLADLDSYAYTLHEAMSGEIFL